MSLLRSYAPALVVLAWAVTRLLGASGTSFLNAPFAFLLILAVVVHVSQQYANQHYRRYSRERHS